MDFPQISTASVGAAGEALVAAMLLSLGMEAAKPFSDNGVDVLAFSTKSYHRMPGTEDAKLLGMVPIQVKTASSPQITVERAWFKIPGLVLVYVWLNEGRGRYFVFDGLADVETFLGGSANTKSWKEDGRWSLSSTNLGPTQIARLEAFENRWDKVSDRLKVES